jgi:hypothetical protein
MLFAVCGCTSGWSTPLCCCCLPLPLLAKTHVHSTPLHAACPVSPKAAERRLKPRALYWPQDEEFLYLVMEYLPGGDMMVSPAAPHCHCSCLSSKFWNVDSPSVRGASIGGVFILAPHGPRRGPWPRALWQSPEVLFLHP